MSKKSIGIFGDSYANSNLDTNASRSWVDVLSDDFVIQNCASPGLSAWHCYQFYKEHAATHDYNVFVIPTFTRLYSKQLESLLPSPVKEKHHKNWYNIQAVIPTIQEDLRSQAHSIKNVDAILKIIDGLDIYYRAILDMDLARQQIMMMVENIKLTAPNVVFIDTNGDSKNNDQGLLGLSLWELEKIGFAGNFTQMTFHNKRILDRRKNHLSEENNIILGNKIKHALENNHCEIKINYNDFVVPNMTLTQAIKIIL